MEMILMSCRNLRRSVKFCCLRTLKNDIPNSNHYSSLSCSSIFTLAELKHSDKIRPFNKRFPSANIWTNVSLRSSDSEDDENNQQVKIVFVRPNGKEFTVFGKVGESVMKAAIQQSEIMQAACEGHLSCTTCHVYVDPKCKNVFPKVGYQEDDLIDHAPFCKPCSRLGCQLILTEEMTELRFGLPPATSNMNVDSDNGRNKKKRHNSS